MSPLVASFREVRADERLDDVALERFLAEAVEVGRRTWPGVDLEPLSFVDFLAHLGDTTALAQRQLGDLYVACACARGSTPAIAALQARVGPTLERALERLGASLDLLSALWERLLTGAPPRIGTYAGTGSLEGWLRVALTRSAIDARRVRHEEPVADAAELERHLASNDLELAFIEHRYRDAFRQAFVSSLRGLGSEERNLLRLHYCDGLTVDQLGAVLGVHRATAARRVARCRQLVLDATRAHLGEHLRVSSETAESLVRMLGANLDVSLSQAFLTPAPENH